MVEDDLRSSDPVWRAEALSEPELTEWGFRVGQEVSTPLLIGFHGGLGAGKSTVIRAIGAGAGVIGHMPSPSYNVLLRHPARSGRSVVHVDLYRLEHPGELEEIGWFALAATNELVLVEWVERAEAFMPPDWWSVHLSAVPGKERYRRVSVVRRGAPSRLPSL